MRHCCFIVQLFCVLGVTTYSAASSLRHPQQIVIDRDVDLNGSVYVVPKGKTLVFENGKILNGVVVGQSTSIRGQGVMFCNVTIEGDWLVPEIRSSFFMNDDETILLKNIFSMTSAQIQNSVYIGSGTYTVSVGDGIAVCELRDSTDVFIDGVIQLVPNSLERYYMFNISNCSNIRISGSGKLVGDKDSHEGVAGEWGMGLYIKDSKNVIVRGLDISKFWGDCITIAGNSSSVTVSRCRLHGSRRQGVSICSGSMITVCDTEIFGVGGTNPGYGIDVEPDAGNSVCGVVICKNTIWDCWGGVLAHGGADNVTVSNLWLVDNNIYGSLKYQPVNIYKFNQVSILHNRIKDESLSCIYIRDSKDIFIQKNSIKTSLRNAGIKLTSDNRGVIDENNLVEVALK